MTQDHSHKRPVLIAGGGIGGMALALTLHQVGVPCIVFEAVPQLQPLGVGINLQPNAVRELHDLGLGNEVLDTIGIQAREWALVGRNGNDVYSEAAWPAGRLPLAAVRGAPRAAADAAVPHGAAAPGARCGAPGPACHRLPPRRGRRGGAAGRP
jgi:2-polyprenyl-6-methoxyphenol hydroxylase-like FAD-dependent oxidoreductase